MAGVEEWHQGRPRQRVAQAWALLATAATVVDVLQAGCARGGEQPCAPHWFITCRAQLGARRAAPLSRNKRPQLWALQSWS